MDCCWQATEDYFDEATLIDVGGGVAWSHELCASEVASAVLVDMASSYLAVAEAEAKRRGSHSLGKFVYGDLTE